jgi:hypothetical protein
MSRELSKGQRVRVTDKNRIPGYAPGDRGTVTAAYSVPASGERHYIVAMDKDHPAHSGAVFTEDEIEPEDGSIACCGEGGTVSSDRQQHQPQG